MIQIMVVVVDFRLMRSRGEQGRIVLRIVGNWEWTYCWPGQGFVLPGPSRSAARNKARNFGKATNACP